MSDIIIDTLLDAVRLFPFLFIAFLLIEFFEHKLRDKNKSIITKSKKFGPIIGSILGAFPQCGFSVIATNLYITRIISIGTLISIYLSTSDEMLPLLLSEKFPIMNILYIILIKVAIGMFFGLLIDFIFTRKNKNKNKDKKLDYTICHNEKCGCNKSILRSSLLHTFKTLFFILIITFGLNILFSVVDSKVLTKLFMKNSLIAPFITSLIGLIPSCGSSIMITELFLNGVIDFSSLLSGLLTGSGVSILLLFRQNKNRKENILILLLAYFIGSMSGLLYNILEIILH